MDEYFKSTAFMQQQKLIGINTKIIRTDLEYPLTFTIAERAANVQKSRETLLCILLFVFL